MPRSVAATAQLEGWRSPVAAALQPVLVVDVRTHLVAASTAATRLLLLGRPGEPMADAVGLRDVAGQWEDGPVARAVRTGRPQHEQLDLPTAGLQVEVVVSPLFGEAGPIGALVFLRSGAAH